MKLIAHRGFAADEPENTLRAIRAVEGRADVVEFDVRRCGSGEIVVVHDVTIDRVTDGSGLVADLPLDELKRYTVLDSGEPIPTLEEAIEVVPPGVEVNVELKELDLARDVVDVVSRADNRVVVTSFLTDELAAVRDVAPAQETGLLVSRSLRQPVTTAVRLDCDVIGARYWRCLCTRLVRRAHEVDLEVHTWTVRRPELARLLWARGVDAVSSDRAIDVGAVRSR